MVLTGCSEDFFGDKSELHDSNRIQLSGDIDQLAVTRVNDNGFCDGDVMGGYESSDFLWGKVTDVAPTTSVIRLPLAHRMSNARVTLIQGSGFADGEWANTEKIVLTANVARKASINLDNTRN